MGRLYACGLYVATYACSCWAGISGHTWAKAIPRNDSGRYAEMSRFAWHFLVASLAKWLGQDLETVSCLSTVSCSFQLSIPRDKQEHGAINHIQYIVINRVTILERNVSGLCCWPGNTDTAIETIIGVDVNCINMAQQEKNIIVINQNIWLLDESKYFYSFFYLILHCIICEMNF